jgi:hypothetical protein
MMFYTGDLFPAWKGNLFVGAMVGQALVRLEIKGERVVSEERLLTSARPASAKSVRVPTERSICSRRRSPEAHSQIRVAWLPRLRQGFGEGLAGALRA